MRRSVAAVLIAITAASCGGGSPASGEPRCKPTHIVRAGSQLPECTFSTIAGTPIRLGALRGKPLVLNFWASWCIACIKEMPSFQRVHGDLGSAVTIVGVDALGPQGETKQFAEQFATARGVTYPIAFDPDASYYSGFGASRISPTLPLTVFVDARGVVRLVNFGEMAERDIHDGIERTGSAG
ncbi:MAG: TlpA family protein disulfide reductase [Actinomycetota bacterium]